MHQAFIQFQSIHESSLFINSVNEPLDLEKFNLTKGYKVDILVHFLDNTEVSTDDRKLYISIEYYYGQHFQLAWNVM